MNLIDLSPSDIVLGQPLKHSVFDRDGNLLLAQGNLVNNHALLEKLQRLGAYKLLLGDPPTLMLAPPEESLPEKSEVSPSLADHSATSAQSVRARPSRTLNDDSTRVIVGTGAITSAALFRGWVDFMHMTDTYTDAPVSCRLSLLGVIDETSLMVTSPTLERDWIDMEEGRRFDATIFNGRRIYTFETTILRRCDEPFRYLHLAFPQSVAERPVRRHLRAAVSLEATLLHDGELSRESTSATIVDLGMISAGLRSANLRLQVGSSASLMFHLEGDERGTMQFRLPSVVRRVHIDARTATATYGVEFVSMAETERQRLQAYVLRAAGAN
jgi:c-di-GMP-binding flagellar brake protein YcgR